MEIAWFTPFDSDKSRVCGVILTSEANEGEQTEYIPVPLEPTTIDECIARGPMWLVEQLPDEFPVFLDKLNCEQFLWLMFTGIRKGVLDAPSLAMLTEMFGGEPHSKDEYWLEYRPDSDS